MGRIALALIATQKADGYLGTYTDDQRWTNWDLWVHYPGQFAVERGPLVLVLDEGVNIQLRDLKNASLKDRNEQLREDRVSGYSLAGVSHVDSAGSTGNPLELWGRLSVRSRHSATWKRGCG